MSQPITRIGGAKVMLFRKIHKSSLYIYCKKNEFSFLFIIFACSILKTCKNQMEAIGLEEVKKIQVEILKEVTRFCEDNGLRYFLAYGTLLGAVRHKGYIPWDDDIDIHMPRPDYEKFLELYSKKEGARYEVVTHEKDKNYHVPFAKIYLKGTLVSEYFYKQSVFGVYIDIFPLDGIKSRWQAYLCGQGVRCMYIKTFKFCEGLSIARKLRLMVTKLILLPLSSHFILKTMRSIATKYNYQDCEYVCSFGSRTALREILPRTVFDEHVFLHFEGSEYRAPKGYDTYLTYKYGNYMQLPPVDKQVSTHDSQAYRI